jgi:hypothetical protein
VRWSLVAALLAGCSGEGGPEALFDAAKAGDTRAVPWPSDALLSGGRLSVSYPFPFDSSNSDNLTQLAATLSEADGFGVTSSVFFPVDQDLVLDAGAAATVVDLEDPAQTRSFPLFYRASTRQLVALAPIGTALKEHHAYGCYVTGGVRGMKGGTLRASAGMADAIAGRGPAAQKGAYPAFAKYLEAQKLSPIAATAFTTQTLTGWVPKAIGDLTAMPPVATVTRVFHAGAELDELFGGPVTTTRPGRPASGGVLHDDVAFAIEGTYDVPHYLSATPGVLGLFDAALTVKATDHVPFMLVLPARASYAATPVVIFQHGINDDRKSVLEVASSFCRSGYAVLGIDELWHGSRRPGAVDLVNNLSGDMVPDGIGDPSSFGAVQYFFDFNGDQARGVPALDPRYMRDSFRQATVDLMQEVRLAKSGNWSAVAAADPALAALTIDGTKLVYAGESFGSILGSQVLALDPELSVGVLDVGGGGFMEDLAARSAEFAQLLQPFVSGAFDTEVDVNAPDELPTHAQMSLNLLQTVIEPGDGLALATEADAQKSVLFLEAFSDETVPNSSTEALAAAWGVTQVMLSKLSVPTKVATFPQTAAPYTATPTRALVQLDPAAHPMITVQDGHRDYMIGFPPFVKLATPQTFPNPIEQVHALAVGFADSYRTATPTVTNPN